VGDVQALGGFMQIGDLVIMKSNPASIGIVVDLYHDVYPVGLQGEDVLDMATVYWWLGDKASFETHRLEVIG